jgi:hypothetical protein
MFKMPKMCKKTLKRSDFNFLKIFFFTKKASTLAYSN